MCTLTFTDFESFDILDAEAALLAGNILASERRAENLRLALLPIVKRGPHIMQRALSEEKRQQQRAERAFTKTAADAPRGGVIVH